MEHATKAAAYKFIILLGITSFFADMTYEGARSINGAYLELLGANATTVGFIAGFGELIGYGLRYLAGYLADKTGRYWTLMILGYSINLLPMPLLALTGHWQVAALLIVLERFGKALRTPSRDAMLSHAGHQLGAGWAFGLHEALDRAGAMLGPLIIALMLFEKNSYQLIYAVLMLPALLSLSAVFIAYKLYPTPRNLEITTPNLQAKDIEPKFWIYLIAASMIGAGYADFSLMAYHFSKTQIFSPALIPFSYAIAMGCSALTMPLLGYFYDRNGIIVLILTLVTAMCFSPMVFLGDRTIAFFGVILWALGTGANDSLMRAIVANMAAVNKRASAYGIFNMCYGIAWFIGSLILGILYDIKIVYLVAFSICVQALAIPLFLQLKKFK